MKYKVPIAIRAWKAKPLFLLKDLKNNFFTTKRWE
jgi:hypothetical protein